METGYISTYEKNELREKAINAAKKINKTIEGKQVYRIKVLNGIVETTNPSKWKGYQHDGVNVGSAYFNIW